MVWYSHLFKNFPQFIVIHTVKGFGIVNKVEIDVFLELSCSFDDPEDVVKQEMARVNINMLGLSELKWTGIGKFNSDDRYIYYCGQESLRRNEEALIVNKRVWNAVLGCKNDRMISVSFQGKPFDITVIQVYAPTTNA